MPPRRGAPSEPGARPGHQPRRCCSRLAAVVLGVLALGWPGRRRCAPRGGPARPPGRFGEALVTYDFRTPTRTGTTSWPSPPGRFRRGVRGGLRSGAGRDHHRGGSHLDRRSSRTSTSPSSTTSGPRPSWSSTSSTTAGRAADPVRRVLPADVRRGRRRVEGRPGHRPELRRRRHPGRRHGSTTVAPPRPVPPHRRYPDAPTAPFRGRGVAPCADARAYDPAANAPDTLPTPRMQGLPMADDEPHG